jgi:hypothetical protein
LKIRLRPFYNARHSYTSFTLFIGAKLAFVSAQTGDSIKTLETHYYAKYIPDADNGRELVEEKILKSETEVKPLAGMGPLLAPLPAGNKKPLISQGLKDGAGEEGRTPDLMLGKHTL